MMKYTVQPVTLPNCQCEDCQAGKHLFDLCRWQDGEWVWVAASLQGYDSAEECKREHYWVLPFEPGAVWEDGTPVVQKRPVCRETVPSNAGETVPLNTEALAKSVDSLQRHWLSPRLAAVKAKRQTRR